VSDGVTLAAWLSLRGSVCDIMEASHVSAHDTTHSYVVSGRNEATQNDQI
jgi:hypothetical protein